MNLDITLVEKIEFVYIELDTNAISFHLPDPNRYFTISTAAYLFTDDLETDPSAGEPSFEIKDQIYSQVGGLETIVFHKNLIQLFFKKNELFLEKYKTVTIHIQDGVSRKIVDFFSNHLFLGHYIQYTEDFDKLLIVSQTEFREEIDDNE